MPHYVYLARCSDGSLYTGTCVDTAARQARHNEGKGSKYTRSRLPVTIVYQEQCATLSQARRREAQVKALRKAQKEGLIADRAREK